jgi:hypothetical protein
MPSWVRGDVGVRFAELERMLDRHGLTTGVIWSIASSKGLDSYGAGKGLQRKCFESDSRYKARLVLDMLIAECAKTKVNT